ncbi:ClcB-like voltage-gated chloride channel protein [Brackiella oedipodis]|uniref:ClcB-like voltage-gated chloride channel protein n=1 Tax=Brackiella oedipodis TaxID=124225 RepID=UPI000688EF37|nr:ClcB-like voltage-gated chloride channel protein [Brackiella oedipodis]
MMRPLDHFRHSGQRLFARPSLLIWAVIMGCLGAGATMLFYESMYLIQYLLSGRSGMVNDVTSTFSTLQTIVFPCIGGLVAGLLLNLSNRFKTDAESDYMEAVALGNGQLSIPQGLARILSALSVVATGGSIGREGPMIHFAAMTASAFGRFFYVDAVHLRLLVACGAAAGVAAAYNTPIAGALFVAEIVIGSMSMVVLGPLLVAAATSHLLMRFSGRYHLLYEMYDVWHYSTEFMLWAVVLGLLAGCATPLFLRYLSFLRQTFKKIPLALPWRMALGGLCMGGFLLLDQRVAGNGDFIVHQLLHNAWAWQSLLLFLLVKVLATGVVVGSGAVGGVLTPVMCVGASVALLMVHAAALIFPEINNFMPEFALLGMGAFLAAATSAPLMAMIMIIEMSQNLSLAAPLIFSCTIAYAVARFFKGLVMYHVTETREQSDLLRSRLRHLHIEDFIQTPQNVINANASVKEAVQKFTQLSVRYIYVVDDENVYQGVIAHKDVTELLFNSGDMQQLIKDSLISRRYLQPLTIGMTLDQIQEHLVNFSGERLPVLDQQEPAHLIGVIYKSEVLAKYSEIKRSLDNTDKVVLDLHAPNSK